MSDAGHHHDGPPGLPEITDEAGDSPKWLPLLGLGLFALVAVLVVARSQAKDGPEPAAAEAAVADAPAAAEPAPTEAAAH